MGTIVNLVNYIDNYDRIEVVPKNKADVNKIWKLTEISGLDVILPVCNYSQTFEIYIHSYPYFNYIKWYDISKELEIFYIDCDRNDKFPTIALIADMNIELPKFTLAWNSELFDNVDIYDYIVSKFSKCFYEIGGELKVTEKCGKLFN